LPKSFFFSNSCAYLNQHFSKYKRSKLIHADITFKDRFFFILFIIKFPTVKEKEIKTNFSEGTARRRDRKGGITKLKRNN